MNFVAMAGMLACQNDVSETVFGHGIIEGGRGAWNVARWMLRIEPHLAQLGFSGDAELDPSHAWGRGSNPILRSAEPRKIMLPHPTSISIAGLALLSALSSCASPHAAIHYRDRVFQIESRRAAEFVAGELVRRGTAFLIDDPGLVLTCAHNLLDGVGSQVTLRSRGQSIEAHVLAVNPEADIALLQTTEAPQAQALRFGLRAIERDEVLWIVGYRKIENAERDAMVSKGPAGRPVDEIWVIKDGERVRYHDLVETGVQILEGLSGGPVLNRDGEVVGLALLADGAAGTYGGAYILPLEALRDGYEQLLRYVDDS